MGLILRRKLTPPPKPPTMVTNGNRSSSDGAVVAPCYPWPNGDTRPATAFRLNGEIVAWSIEAKFSEVPIMRCFRCETLFGARKWRRYQRVSLTTAREVTPGLKPEVLGEPVPFGADARVTVTESIAQMIVARQ